MINYQDYMNLPVNEKLGYFMKTRFASNRTPEYWVNWNNVVANMKSHRQNLRVLSSLIRQVNIRNEAKELFINQPDLLRSVPIILAIRNCHLELLGFTDDSEMYNYSLDFSHPNLNKIEDYLDFLEDSGTFNFLKNELEGSLVDYVFGIQAGLDSNGRKNRGGTENEKILAQNLNLIREKTNWETKTQATAKEMLRDWKVKVPERSKKGGRRYDGAIFVPNKNKIIVIETNFYGGGGSKLKAVAGEFSDLYETNFKDNDTVNFVWISDGPGWTKAKNPLREAFEKIPAIFNLKMVKNGFLLNSVNQFSHKH